MSWRGTEETKHNTAKSNNTGRQSVLQLTTMSCATTAEPIKTTFGVRTRGEPPISWGADRPTKIALWGSYLGMFRLARGSIFSTSFTRGRKRCGLWLQLVLRSNQCVSDWQVVSWLRSIVRRVCTSALSETRWTTSSDLSAAKSPVSSAAQQRLIHTADATKLSSFVAASSVNWVTQRQRRSTNNEEVKKLNNQLIAIPLQPIAHKYSPLTGWNKMNNSVASSPEVSK